MEHSENNHQMSPALKNTIDNITQIISLKQTGNNALASVVEVEVLMSLNKKSSDIGKHFHLLNSLKLYKGNSSYKIWYKY